MSGIKYLLPNFLLRSNPAISSSKNLEPPAKKKRIEKVRKNERKNEEEMDADDDNRDGGPGQEGGGQVGGGPGAEGGEREEGELGDQDNGEGGEGPPGENQEEGSDSDDNQDEEDKDGEDKDDEGEDDEDDEDGSEDSEEEGNQAEPPAAVEQASPPPSKKEKTSQTCQRCPGDRRRCVFCSDCDLWICNLCYDQHRRNANTRDHKTVTVQDKRQALLDVVDRVKQDLREWMEKQEGEENPKPEETRLRQQMGGWLQEMIVKFRDFDYTENFVLSNKTIDREFPWIMEKVGAWFLVQKYGKIQFFVQKHVRGRFSPKKPNQIANIRKVRNEIWVCQRQDASKAYLVRYDMNLRRISHFDRKFAECRDVCEFPDNEHIFVAIEKGGKKTALHDTMGVYFKKVDARGEWERDQKFEQVTQSTGAPKRPYNALAMCPLTDGTEYLFCGYNIRIDLISRIRRKEDGKFELDDVGVGKRTTNCGKCKSLIWHKKTLYCTVNSTFYALTARGHFKKKIKPPKLENMPILKTPILYRTDIPGRMLVAYNEGRNLFLFAPEEEFWIPIGLPDEVEKIDAAQLADAKLYVAFKNKLWILGNEHKAFHIDRFRVKEEIMG